MSGQSLCFTSTMAKYLGLLSSDARGKLGGMVMSRSRSATTLKAHASPRRAPSVAQQLQRCTIAAAQSAWRQLTNAQRTTWISYAATLQWSNSLGSTFAPTGLMLWVQAFSNAARFHQKPPASFPLPPTATIPISAAQITLSTFLKVTVNPSDSSYSNDWIVGLSRPIPATRNYIRSVPTRFMGAASFDQTWNVQPAWVAAFGPLPIVGAIVVARLTPVAYDSYISGTPVTIAVTVGA